MEYNNSKHILVPHRVLEMVYEQKCGVSNYLGQCLYPCCALCICIGKNFLGTFLPHSYHVEAATEEGLIYANSTQQAQIHLSADSIP